MKPSTGLSAVAIDAGGTETTWWSGDRRAYNRPQQIRGGSRIGEGFADGGATLARDIRRSYFDCNLYDTVVFVGDDGDIAYEGRIGAQPRSTDGGHRIDVQLAGWMAHASSDEKFGPFTYVNRDLSRWNGMGSAFRIANPTFAFSDGSVRDDDTGTPALWTSLDGGAAAVQPFVISQYDAGPRNPIGSVYYAWQRLNIDNADTNYSWAVTLGTDDTYSSSNGSGDLRAAGPGTGTLTATTADRRYAHAGWLYSISGDWTEQAAIIWTALAVYGNQGLTKRGTAPQGYYASDMIRDLAARYCPLLNTSGVEDTTLVFPHADFTDRGYPHDAFLLLNGPHNYELAVWENKTLTFRPYDLSNYDWEVTTDQPGVDVSLQGDTTRELANYVVVEFDDVTTGKRGQVGPWDSSDLEDTTVDHPANTHGLNVELTVGLTFPADSALAIKFGRSYLEEFNRPKNRGQIKVRGHIKDAAGHWNQFWKPRYGQTISVADHENPAPRLITEASWDNNSKTTTISTDNGELNMLEAVVDYTNTSLRAKGLGS